MTRHSWRSVCAAAVFALPIGSVCAQSADVYPSRPVTLIVPFAPGAATDIEGRIKEFDISFDDAKN